MAASSTFPSTQSPTANPGLRPVRLRQDLGAIADLIELSFGADMDSAGRAAVREMRSLSRSGPLLWLLASLDRGLRSMNKGFVWIDPPTGRLVGNVSIYDVHLPKTLVIANVAVHPEYRRRGIARAIMDAALETARQRNMETVLLQVDAENEGAQKLYTNLDFAIERVFTRWQWYPTYTAIIPARRNAAPDITMRSRHEWRQIYDLAKRIRPNVAGGLGWLRPTTPTTFKRTLGETVLSALGLQSRQWWVARDSERQLLAALSMQNTFGSRYRPLELLVEPDAQGQLEHDMLGFAMRLVADYRRGLMLEHPADDPHAATALREHDFKIKRRLMHMRWHVD